MLKLYCYTLYVISMQKVNKKRVKLSLHPNFFFLFLFYLLGTYVRFPLRLL